jgi:hypothetical protein
MQTSETPAAHIITKLGGLTKTARMLSDAERQFAVSTVQGWKERGKIPQEYWLPLIEAARNDGIDIELTMFLESPEAAQ